MSRRRDPQAKVERPGHTQSDLFLIRFARLRRRRGRRGRCHHHHHHHHRVCAPGVSPSCAFPVSVAALASLVGIRKKKWDAMLLISESPLPRILPARPEEHGHSAMEVTDTVVVS